MENNCTNNTIIYIKDFCLCEDGYYGNECQYFYNWYPSTIIVISIIQYICILISLFWCIIKFINSYQKEKKKERYIFVLSIVIITFIANIIRIVSLSINFIKYDSLIIKLIKSIIFSLSTSLWVISSLLLAGFCMNVLDSNIRLKLTNKIKILFILCSIISFILILIDNFFILINYQYRFSLLISVLIINIIIILIYIIRIYKSKTNSLKSISKKNWVLSCMIPIEISWTLYVILLIIKISYFELNYIINIIISLLESIIIILLTLLCYNNIILIKFFFNKLIKKEDKLPQDKESNTEEISEITHDDKSTSEVTHDKSTSTTISVEESESE